MKPGALPNLARAIAITLRLAILTPLLTMPVKSSAAEPSFSLSGVIVDSQSQKGLPGVSVHLARLLKAPQKGFETVKREIVVTGPDGGFKAACPDLKTSDLPLMIEVGLPILDGQGR